MKITARPLKGESFEVEIEAEQKIEDLKKSIAAKKPELVAELQKIIHAGKILADGTTIAEHGLKENDFVVVMAAKAKPPASAPAASAPPTAASTPAAPAAAAPAPAAPAPAAPAPAPASTPPQNEGAVAQLCDMGFEREKVVECLRAAFNNADRAVEYLMSGIPERARSRSPPPHQASQGHSGSLGDGHDSGGQGHAAGQGHEGHDAPGHDCSRDHGGNDSHSGHAGHSAHGGHSAPGGHEGHDAPGHDCSRDHGHASEGGQGHGHGHGQTQPAGNSAAAFPAMPPAGPAADGRHAAASGALEQLRLHPRFGELSEMVLQNPSVLPQMLTALAATNPELAQSIQSNQEEFLAMLAGDDDDDDDGHSHGGAGDGEGGTVTIQVSEADQAAVERLAALGFAPEQALEAYIACDRKEELAANFLFDNMGA